MNAPARPPLVSPTARLSQLLRGPALLHVMEVHSGLSARAAQAAGFDALWASGLAISSLIGVRDSNEASWTQVLSVVEWITDATDRPVIVDGDSGHGNFNNARKFARKVADRGAAAVCFEDKLFPKTNSFVGERQALAAAEEFCGKLSASRDAVGDSLMIIARTEALVSGYPMSEALDRCALYIEAGADAVLVHSKSSEPHEVLECARQWDRRAPLLVVPTTYPQVRPDQLEEAGVSAAVWANHGLRTSLRAMLDIYQEIRRTGGPLSSADRLASLSELFALLDYGELARAECRYLPEKGE